MSESDNKSQLALDEAILKLLAENPSITQTDAATRLGIARTTLAKHLANLQANGRLRRVGARKNGRWELLTD